MYRYKNQHGARCPLDVAAHAGAQLGCCKRTEHPCPPSHTVGIQQRSYIAQESTQNHAVVMAGPGIVARFEGLHGRLCIHRHVAVWLCIFFLFNIFSYNNHTTNALHVMEAVRITYRQLPGVIFWKHSSSSLCLATAESTHPGSVLQHGDAHLLPAGTLCHRYQEARSGA